MISASGHPLLRPLSLRGEQLLLALLLCQTLAWHLWAVLTDQHWTPADNYIPEALSLLKLPPEALWNSLLHCAPKGPVMPVLAALLVRLTGEPMVGGRLAGVLLHCVLILQCYSLAERLLPRRGAGLWAGLLCAVTPLVFGYCRLEYHEHMVACLLLAAISQLLEPLSRVRQALLLGLFVGLGVLTKLSAPVFLAFPLLWWFPRQLATRRRALLLLLSAAAGAAPALPWLAANRQAILENYQLSTGTQFDLPPLEKARIIFSLPGVLPVVLGAVLAVVALGRSRRLHWHTLVMLLGAVLVPLMMFSLWFNLWSRYVLPSVVLAAAVAAPAVALLLHRLAPLPRRLAAAATAALLLGMFAVVNLQGIPSREPREQYSGLLTPFRLPYTSLRRAASFIRDRGARRALYSFGTGHAAGRYEGISDLVSFWGLLEFNYSPPEARERLSAGGDLWVLFLSEIPLQDLTFPEIKGHWLNADSDPSVVEAIRDTTWILSVPGRVVLFSQQDPDGMWYHVFYLSAPTSARRP